MFSKDRLSNKNETKFTQRSPEGRNQSSIQFVEEDRLAEDSTEKARSPLPQSSMLEADKKKPELTLQNMENSEADAEEAVARSRASRRELNNMSV